MDYFRRIHCHFCGARSTHSKSSGIRTFQCTQCEAVNYLDRRGSITNPPSAATTQPQRGTREQSPPFQTFTQQLPETLGHQQSQAFCNTCQLHQRMYVEALSNYLPDEDDPRYQEFEDALPVFKKELEKRYPQVCKRCAPKAQKKINRADYYAGTQNISRRANGDVRKAKRSRDDWGKWSMRLLLRLVGLAVYGSLAVQIAWHAYAFYIFRSDESIAKSSNTMFLDAETLGGDELVLPSHQQRLLFFNSYLPRAILVSACLIWYNSGLRYWYHHTLRIEALKGQIEHFWLQAFLLLVRIVAAYKLADPQLTGNLTRHQLLAAHGFVVILICLIQWLSEKPIKPIKWKMRQRMMPSPEQRDVLGAIAGPETDEGYASQASSIPPSQLFARDRITPFPIANLAPQQVARNKLTGLPSPVPSDETDEDGDGYDPMDIDDGPALRKQMPGAPVDRQYRPRVAQKRSTMTTRNTLNHSNTATGPGWSGMRDEIFGLQNDIRTANAQKAKEQAERSKLKFEPPVQQSPFRGRLPAAPKSMESRLRNPMTQLSFKETPASKKQDFMTKMREGIEAEKIFGMSPAPTRKTRVEVEGVNVDMAEDDDDFSPVKSRTRGGLDLRPSAWNFAGDADKATGLEDLFGGNSFSINEQPVLPAAARTKKAQHGSLKVAFGVGLPVVVALVVGWKVPAIRRAVALWLVARMEELGY